MKHSLLLTAVVVGAALSGCLPSNLDKYRRKDRASAPVDDPFLPRSREPEPTATVRPASARDADRVRATIYAVDKNTYRFALAEAAVWDAALNVLLRNYNLTIVDRQSGVVTTEWDSYFLDREVFRNRLSLRIARSGRDQVDVTLHNNVERLRDASQATSAVGAVWLPAEDKGTETTRIIQNMALLLNQPPPVFPPNGTVATKSGSSIDPNEPKDANY